MRHNCFTLLCLLLAAQLSAQTFRVKGKVTDNKLQPLPLVSIQVKETRTGTLTRNDGTYELFLEEGKYDLVVTMIGYKSQTFTLVVQKDYIQNVLLEEAERGMEEVVVRTRSKDKAEEYIRNVIRRKEELLAAPGPYSCRLYIKAVQQDSGTAPVRKKDTAGPSIRPDAELARMAMTEVLLHLDYESPGRLKEERLAVKTNGNPDNLFYLSTLDGDFNFYRNLLQLPALSTATFLSPISYSGLLAYKYKTVRIEKSGNHKIYTISIRGKGMSNATVEGELTLSDSAWVVLHSRFRFPRFHLPEYDFFEVEQRYGFIAGKAWMLTEQQFTYQSNSSKRKRSGQTSVVYKDYELNRTFPKKHFGLEVSATTADAYKRDSTFWDTVRVAPLTAKEISFIRYKDSVYRATHTKHYLDSIDAKTNRVNWKKLALTGQTIYNREKERTLFFPPAASLYQPLVFGGARINPSFGYSKLYPSRKHLSLNVNISYGLRNKDVNGSFRLRKQYNPFSRGYYTINLGREFESIFQGDAWINMLKRSNVFLNNMIGGGHGLDIRNGLHVFTGLDFAFRSSVYQYKTNDLTDSLLGSILTNNKAIDFEPYNALYSRITLSYTPFQRYIREPKEKVILGSSWPTFFTTWRKGVRGVWNSKVDFDYLEFGLEQKIHAGLLGNSRYTAKTGSFLNKKELRMNDYQFQRQGDPLLMLNPDEAFQALDSTFPLFRRFYQGHFVHEFNGFFINKVPLLKKLALREVGGAGFLVAPERNLRYAEMFGGVERVFRWPFNPDTRFKLGVYVVGSVANRFRNPVQFKIGITSWDKRRNRWF